MSGNDQVAEGAKRQAKDPAAEAEDKLFSDSVKNLSQSIEKQDVTSGLKTLDEKINALDLGPEAADALINNVFSELRKNGELPTLVSQFYKQNKDKLTLGDKTYLDIESLDQRLPGGGVYDLTRAERHVAAFIADNAKKIIAADYNLTYSDDQFSDGDFAEYGKQQADEFKRYTMAKKIQKHFGSQESFDILDAAGANKVNGSINQLDLAEASKMNKWHTSFSLDAQTKQVGQERQEVLDYLIKKFDSIHGSSYGLNRDELALFIAGEKDPRTAQVIDTKNRLFGGNPGPEAYQKAVAEGYKGSLSKFSSDFLKARMNEGMTAQEANRELNRSTELSGFRADVVKKYLTDNMEALGATRSEEITREALEKLKERKSTEGKLREVEILETALNRFGMIANKVSESSWSTDKIIKPHDLDAYAEAEKAERAKAKFAIKMHNLAHANIHELSGESREKKEFDIKVPWSKIESMKKFYENAEKNPGKFTDEQRAHHKEMKELCEYLAKNMKTTPQRGNSSGHDFNLSKSYSFQEKLDRHNKDRFDAPKQVEKPKVQVPKVEVPKVEVPKVEVPKVEVPKVEPPKVELPKVEVPKVEVPKVEPPKVEPENKAPDLIKPEETPDDRPKIEPFIGPLPQLPSYPNVYDFSGEGDSGIERPSEQPALPRSERPLTPSEYERGAADGLEQTQSDKSEQVADKLTQNEFEKIKEAFQFEAVQYGNALRQAARENKPLVLIAGTKNSSAEFLKSAAAQANNDKAVYVFVDLDSAKAEWPITRYLETSIAQRNQQTNQHDDNWISVFKVSSDGRGGVVNHSPEYTNTGAKASNADSVQKAIDDASAKSMDRARAYSNQGTVYSYEQGRPATNYYNSNCRPRRGVFGLRR